MIDASHNTKDPLEDLIQSLEAIQVAYARALLVNLSQLNSAQQEHDTAGAQQLLQEAFCTDVRPLVQEARLRQGGALQPLNCYRQAGIRKTLTAQRGSQTTASGL
jgi:L-rhamnose isomerase/sugar isomerase